ncbi:MAG: protein-L-isoaspartate(D-aspartate) O-methyltransferase [Gammaproteobacteria bacterium]|nr:protein-L-isoaspartate(D-aspartate) O-methyltransferase [Gammaproteobacteria bacterium]
MTSRRTRNRLVARLRKAGIADERVLDAIASVPRHIFVDEALAHRAYEDSALPIGHGQTISQPYVVAAMTAAVLGKGSGNGGPRRVLEIGTGCGYQTAILATLVERVFTMERIGSLLERARDRLGALGIRNVRFRHADGNGGWREEAPFDAILVTAGATHVPDAVMEQVADGATLVMPVGNGDVQELKRLERMGDAWRQETLEHVRFVPMLRGVQA